MITFAPSFSNYRRHVAGLVPAAIVLLFIDYFRIRQPLPIYIAECVVLIGLGVGFGALYFRNTRIAAERHSLSITNLFGRTHEVSGDRLAKAVLVENLMIYGSAAPAQRLMVLDTEGRPVLKWNGATWTTEEMGRLMTTLGIPIESVSGPTTPGKLRKTYPHAVNTLEAHPVWWGVGIALVIVVVVVVVVIAVVGVN